MSIEENKKIIVQFYDAFNHQDLATFDQILAVDWVNHPADAGRENNRDGFKLGMQDFHKAFENFLLIKEQIVAEGNFVVCRIKMSGNHVHDLGDWKAIGQYIEFSGMDMHRLENGKIQETWHFEYMP